jgi:hypothetical protein
MNREAPRVLPALCTHVTGQEPEKLAEFYDASFLGAGPSGSAAFKNDEAFLGWLREVHALNAKTLLTSLTVGTTDERPVGAGCTS